MSFRSLWVAGCLLSVLSIVHAQNNSAKDQSIEPNLIANAYRNQTLGFSCKIPFGWVERTQAMQQGSSDASTSHVLLAVFERPPEAMGETINSGIVIAVESAVSYPKVKTARDYFEPLAEAAAAQKFQVVNEPYSFAVGAKQLVREDFSKPHGKLTMYQSSLVTIRKGSIVSFTFIGSNLDEVDELIENLSFASSAPRSH